MKAILWLALACLAPALPSVSETPAMLADASFRVGGLEVALLDAGFYRDRSGKFSPGGSLSFGEIGTEKKFQRSVTVELVESSSGRRLGSWKSRISLKPGKRLQRRYAGEGLPRWASVEAAPALAFRVTVGAKASGLLALPATEQHFADSPPPKLKAGFHAGKAFSVKDKP